MLPTPKPHQIPSWCSSRSAQKPATWDQIRAGTPPAKATTVTHQAESGGLQHLPGQYYVVHAECSDGQDAAYQVAPILSIAKALGQPKSRNPVHDLASLARFGLSQDSAPGGSPLGPHPGHQSILARDLLNQITQDGQ